MDKIQIPISYLSEMLKEGEVTIEQVFGLFLEELVKSRNESTKSIAHKCFLLDDEMDDLLTGKTPCDLIEDDVLCELAKHLKFPVNGFRILLHREPKSDIEERIDRLIIRILDDIDKKNIQQLVNSKSKSEEKPDQDIRKKVRRSPGRKSKWLLRRSKQKNSENVSNYDVQMGVG